MKRFVQISLGTAGLVAVVFLLLWFFVLTTLASREVGKLARGVLERVQPDAGKEIYAYSGAFEVLEAQGIPKELVGQKVNYSFQLPDKLNVFALIDGNSYAIGRNGDRVWMNVPHKDLAIEGTNEVPRFSKDPGSVMPVELPDLRIPLTRWQMLLLPALITAEKNAFGGCRCEPKDWVVERYGVPPFLLEWKLDDRGWLGEVRFEKVDLKVSAAHEHGSLGRSKFGDWELPVENGKPVERVALAHLDRFVSVALGNLNASIEPLPPLSGERSLLATHGKGRLESIEGTKVLFLEGSPEEMGEQHGVLMKDEVKNLIDRMVYGVGVGSSFDKGRWFFGEIEEAQSRLEPFIDERYLREMDALAAAAEVHPQEARLANFFPELFHCTGFALHGTATAGGRMFHGRVLDYLRGLGLEQNAVVMVVRPDEGNAWVNVGYAGFIGSVTAMNEKHVAIGEMGGRGEGNWDGKPMAQLMREVMERADTIEEAVAIFEEGPRTCEYYYVISDAKSMKAVGIKSTPEIFETVWSGESHPQLPEPIEDTVLMSANDRYTELVKRVKANFGKFEAESALELMTRPVCMKSNIQSVLFAPDTLDFWVANADSENVASATRYTKYNLRELLDGEEETAKLTKVGAE